MNDSGLLDMLHWHLGPVLISQAVVTTWLIMLLLGVGAWLATRRLTREPGRVQTVLEALVGAIDDAVRAVAPHDHARVTPFIATLWIYLGVANLVGVVPGLSSPTRNLSVTAGLALLVFLSVHWFGIRSQGLRGYLRHYLRPSPLLLPFHLISEITRTLALAVRLFGNMMSLEMAALLVLMVAAFLAPIPILMLHIVEALVQAYLFGMLALIYVAGGLQSQQLRKPNKE